MEMLIYGDMDKREKHMLTLKHTLNRLHSAWPAMRIRNDFMRIWILQIWSVRIRIPPDPAPDP